MKKDKDLKAILKTAETKTDTVAYEKGYANGFAEGRRVGHEEGAKAWAEMAVANEAAKAKTS